jgi:hypothetical protein
MWRSRSWIDLRAAAAASLVALLLARPAVAEDAPTLFVHLTNASWSGCETIDPASMDCSDIDVEGNSTGYQFAFVMVGGIGAITGAQFGVEYEGTVDVADWTLCTGGMQITQEGWPASGKGIAVTWAETEFPSSTDSLVVVGYFLIEPSSSGTIEVTADERIEQAVYIDDATEQNEFAGLGVADANGGGQGYSTCGSSDPGDDAGDGGTGGSDDGDDGDEDDGAGSNTRNVFVYFTRGSINPPEGRDTTTVEESGLSNAEIRATLHEHQVIDIVNAHPGYDRADTVVVARTGKRVRLIDMSGCYLLRLPEASPIDPLIEELSGFPEVGFVAPESDTESGDVFPNDPRFVAGEQWGLTSHLSGTGTPALDPDIDAPEAWRWGNQGVGVTIVIAEVHPLHPNHEDLQDKVVPGGDPPKPGEYHGLQVASVAAAATNNGIGMSGAGWHAMLYSKLWDDLPLATLHELFMPGGVEASILNASVCAGGAFAERWMPIRNVHMLDGLIVAIMGNLPAQINCFPAIFGRTLPGIVAVGSVREDGQPSDFSAPNDFIDVSAPGEDILVATLNGTTSDYTTGNGTSYAAPMVSGLAALLRSHDHPTLSAEDVEQLLRLGADNVPQPGEQPDGWDEKTGYGAVDGYTSFALQHEPYTMERDSVSGGQFSGVEVGPFALRLFGVDGFADGTLVDAVQKEVLCDVAWNTSGVLIHAWGRGAGGMSEGLGYPTGVPFQNYLPGNTWCEVVPGSETTTGCVLRTYMYEVSDPGSGVLLGEIPLGETPETLSFSYTALFFTGPAVEVADLETPRETATLRVVNNPTPGPVGFRISVPNLRRVDFRVFDASGRTVSVLHRGPLSRGNYSFTWNRREDNTAPGVYYVRLRHGRDERVEKVVILGE